MLRSVLITAVAVMSLAVVAVATAKTVTVSITKNGYVPNAVTVATSDGVQFTNNDTLAHQIVFKSTTGVTCAPNPLVLQPGQSGTCTFASAGSFSYSDPNVKGNTYRGSVTVTGTAAADSLTITAKPTVVVFSGKVTLSGTLSNQKVGENVDVLATACGQNAASKVTTVQTTTAGAYTAAVQPLQNTIYTVKVKSTSSKSVSVKVKPRLRLSKIAAHRYSLRVSAAQSLAGKYGTFQRFNLHRWVAIKRVLLRTNATGVAPTVISSAAFRSTIKSGSKVRMILPQIQVGSCYLPGLSNTIYS